MRTFLLIFLLCALPVQALELDGRLVILLVGEHRNGDERVDALRAALLQARESRGLETADLPVVTMGFRDSDTESAYFSRLGFSESSSPVLCVARWGNPASYGPKEVVDSAIVRMASSGDVENVVEQFTRLSEPEAPQPDPPAQKVEQAGYQFDLDSSFRVVDTAVGEEIFGKANLLVGEPQPREFIRYDLVAVTGEGEPEAAFALVKIDRPFHANKRIRRLLKRFKRRLSSEGYPVKGPTVESIRGRNYFKFESPRGEKRREIYFLAPRGQKTIYVFTFEAPEANFVPLSPLFRETVESLEL